MQIVNKYMITEEECRKSCRGKVCRRCGGAISPIETVDNSNNPTYWSGCLECMIFSDGTTKEIYEIADGMRQDYQISMEDLCSIIYRARRNNCSVCGLKVRNGV